MRLSHLLNEITTVLRVSHREAAPAYAERILTQELGCDRTSLFTHADYDITEECCRICRDVAWRCREGEPLEYIYGAAYFYNREFKVTSSVLIPRPDTETLVETVFAHETCSGAFFADIGTGSGILACILTEKYRDWYAVAVDCSYPALKIVRENRRSLRVCPLCMDLLSSFVPARQFDFIVSNPPYIPSGNIPLLECSVRDFEPVSALDGGNDGLGFYRYFSTEASAYLKPGGALYCEIGFDQGKAVPMLFKYEHWKEHEVINDLSGNPRVFRVVSQDGDT